MTLRIAILGSGPAGLTAALALEKSSNAAVSITLLDRNKSATDYKGVEYGIRERACEALERLGLKDQALAGAHEPSEQVFHNAGTDEIERRVAIKPGTTFNVLRTEFLERLTNFLSRTEILRERNAVRLEVREGGGVRIHFSDEKDGVVNEPLDFDVMIAADGANSVARRQYFPHATTLDRGFSSIYMLVEAKKGDTRIPKHFLDLANGTFNFYSHGKFASSIIFPEGRDRLTLALNFDHATASQVWRQHGLTPDVEWSDMPVEVKKSIARTMARDTPAYDGLMAKALELIEDWNSPAIYAWEMRDSDALDEPYAPDANIVFVGDSARAFLPTIGMGASLAIEDAEWLGTRLGTYLSSSTPTTISLNDIREKVFVPYLEARRDTWLDLLDRARMAARNNIDQKSMNRYEAAAFVPTEIGKKVVHAVEQVRRSLNL
jgi:salicylate hydroxylase